MIRQREPVELEVGDWIVYNPAKPSGAETKALGGPWRYGKLKARGVSGWTIMPSNGLGPAFVLDPSIIRVCLSRGEAHDFAESLSIVQREYLNEQKTLKPKFEQRIRDLLNA